MNLISRKISGATHYWNGTGWTTDRRSARIYNEHDARQAHKAMTMDGIMADIRKIKKRS